MLSHKWQEMTGNRRQLGRRTPRNLYALPHMMMKWAGQAARLGKRKDAYKIVVVRSKGPRLLGKFRRRLEVRVIKLILKEIGSVRGTEC
jgi:protein required for attachment to host cells